MSLEINTERQISQSELYARHGVGNITAETEGWRWNTAPFAFAPEIQKAYPFTTENIDSYIGALALPADARVAAICGSGDFGFSAVMAGAGSVDHVDTLQTACLYAELKAVGLEQLDLESFKQFFGSTRHDDNGVTTPGRMEYGVYQNLRPHLTPQAAHYFDQLITPSGPAPYLRQGFLINKIRDVPANMAMVPYLQSEAAYTAAQSSREKSRFYPLAMQHFTRTAGDDSYDAVYLSNIGAYMSNTYNDLLADSARITRPGGIIIETGFMAPDDPMENIQAQKRSRATVIGSTAVPQIVTGPFTPMPGYGTHATIYTKDR